MIRGELINLGDRGQELQLEVWFMAKQFRSLAPSLAENPSDQEMLLYSVGDQTGLKDTRIVEVRAIVPESHRVLVRHQNGWHRTLEYGGDFATNCLDINGDPGTHFRLSFA